MCRDFTHSSARETVQILHSVHASDGYRNMCAYISMLYVGTISSLNEALLEMEEAGRAQRSRLSDMGRELEEYRTTRETLEQSVVCLENKLFGCEAEKSRLTTVVETLQAQLEGQFIT